MSFTDAIFESTSGITTTGATGGDNGLFNIDPKTGKITSKAALDAGAATDTNGNGSTAGNGVYDIQVTYTPLHLQMVEHMVF